MFTLRLTFQGFSREAKDRVVMVKVKFPNPPRIYDNGHDIPILIDYSNGASNESMYLAVKRRFGNHFETTKKKETVLFCLY